MGLALKENSHTAPSLQLPYLILKFLSHDGQVFLEATEFAFSGTEVHRCARGANSIVPNVGTFRWNQAVRAMSILALRHFIYRDSDRAEDRSLAGGAGSLAASLDYSIAKNTAWLAEVFGSDSNGTLIIRKLITRQNPERKRPGPVVVAFTKKVADMGFYLNGEKVSGTDALRDLLSMLEPDNDGAIDSAPMNGGGGEAGKSSVLPTNDKRILRELDRYVRVVIQNTFNPYISVSTSEVWSSADAILALIRIPEAKSHLKVGLPFVLDLLCPPAPVGYTVDESDLPIPVVAATCVLALAELRQSVIIDESLRRQISEFFEIALRQLLDYQAKPGWWTIIGSPASVLEYAENARVWDTAYVVLVLEHLIRLGQGDSLVDGARSRALAWLLRVYDPQMGWSNSPSQPFRISPALNTFVQFVLMYSSRDLAHDSSWAPTHAKMHVESLRSPIEWIEEIDKHDYRLKGAQGLSLPHPHHINHGAFLFALIKILEVVKRDGEVPIKLHFSWSDMFAQLERQNAVYLFSQVLQGIHLFHWE